MPASRPRANDEEAELIIEAISLLTQRQAELERRLSFLEAQLPAAGSESRLQRLREHIQELRTGSPDSVPAIGPPIALPTVSSPAVLPTVGAPAAVAPPPADAARADRTRLVAVTSDTSHLEPVTADRPDVEPVAAEPDRTAPGPEAARMPLSRASMLAPLAQPAVPTLLMLAGGVLVLYAALWQLALLLGFS